MKDSSRYIYYLIFTICQLLSFGAAAYAPSADSLAASPAAVVVRLPDPEKLENMRRHKDFQYFEEVSPDETFWQRLQYKLKQWLNKLFYKGQTSGFWEVVIYLFIIATIVFVIIKMQQVDVPGLFGRKTKTEATPYTVLEENIHELDLKALIEEAEAQREFRKAIRLHYLQSLKKLTDANIIQWKPGKTNRCYSTEIQYPHIRQEFEQLTSMFEYVWYGGAALGGDFFENAKHEFEQFDNLLKQRA
jgi:hypothetical protein